MSLIKRTLVLTILAFTTQSLIVRHDIPDEQFIELAKQYNQICHFPMGEGTLIGASWILTAAHVAEALKRDRENGIDASVICNGQEYTIEKIIIHPSYKFTQFEIQHDIALIKLSNRVDEVLPIKIYKNEDELGKKITIVGAGDMGNGLTGPQKWDKITRAATNKIDFVDTQWIAFTFDAPDSKEVTEFEGVSGPGDSGGPAIVKIEGDHYIVGVSSNQRNSETSGPGRYGVKEYYARVSSYAEWVEKVMAKN